MRRLEFKSRYVRDLKRIKRRDYDENKFFAILGILMCDGHLPSQFQPHKLTSEYEGLWECHVGPDWLFVYDINAEEVIAYRTGSHSDLFG